MINFAVPALTTALKLTPQEFGLTSAVYAAASIVMLVKHRWMVERLGYRRFALASLAVFAIGCAICSLSDGLGQFLAGRALQGLGCATFFTAGRMAVTFVPAQRRFHALLCYVTAILLSLAIAPLASAAILKYASWRALFWMPLPAIFTAGVLVKQSFPGWRMPTTLRSNEHWAWLMLLVAGVVALQYIVHFLPFDALRHPGRHSLLALVAFGLLAAFFRRQYHGALPLLDVRSLSQQRYFTGLLLYFLCYLAVGANGYLLPLYLHSGLGIREMDTALLLAMASVIGLLAAYWQAFRFRRQPQFRRHLIMGLAALALASALMLMQSRHVGQWQLVPALLLFGVFPSLFFGVLAAGTFSAIPEAGLSHAYQVKNIARQLALSSSVVGNSWYLQSTLDAYHAPSAAMESTGLALAPNFSSAVIQASTGYFTTMLVCAVLMGIVICFQRVFK